MNDKWRCHACGLLLGIVRGDRLHIRIARGHEYMVGFPVTATCRSCGALNELVGRPNQEEKNTAERR